MSRYSRFAPLVPRGRWLLPLHLLVCFLATATTACAQYGTLIRQDYRTDEFRTNITGKAIACADSLHCIVIGGDNRKEEGHAVQIAARYTRDGGMRWHTWYDTMPVPMFTFLRGVAYPTPSLAIMVGDSGMIYRTTDGGESWQRVPSGTTQGLGIISMIDSLHGIVSNGTLILRTTDGGQTWREDSRPDAPDSLSVSAHRCATTTLQHMSCLQYTASGPILSTTLDGGNSWHHTTAPFMQRITFLDPQYGWGIGGDVHRASGNDIVYIGRTVDSGHTWQTVFADSSFLFHNLSAIDFADRLNGIVGSYEAMYRTYDGGESWINLFKVWGLESSYWKMDIANFADGPQHISYPTRGKAWLFNSMLGTLLYTEDQQFSTVGVDQRSERTLGVFPSPASGSECSLRLRLPERCRGRLSLVDVVGREVAVLADGELRSGEQSYSIDLTALPPGRYFARLSTAEWIDTFSFLRE